MRSADNETLSLDEAVVVNESVEAWFSVLETSIMSSMRTCVVAALEDMRESPMGRIAWAIGTPGGAPPRPCQATLLAAEVAWARDLSRRLQQPQTPPRWRALLFRHVAVLESMAFFFTGQPSQGQRRVLASHVVAEVRRRDCVASLGAESCTAAEEFAWQRIPRYELRFADESLASRAPPAVVLRQLQCAHDYAWEYQGRQPRLAITALAGKALFALLQTMWLGQGAALVGRSGSGKTATVKELAAMLGRPYVTLLCTAAMAADPVVAFASGAAAAGAVLGVDNMAHLPTSAASALAQVLGEVLQVLRRGEHELPSGVRVHPMAAFSACVVPGTGPGRTGLPQSLVALVRPINLMSPSPAAVVELKLMAAGFARARQLAPKMAAVVDGVASLFNGRGHIVADVRLLLAATDTAIALLAHGLATGEEVVVRRALALAIEPSLGPEDRDELERLLAAAWPAELAGNVEPTSGPGRWAGPEGRGRLEEAARVLGLELTPTIMAKAVELAEALNASRGVILVGGPCLGKSSVLRLASVALALADDAILGAQSVHQAGPRPWKSWAARGTERTPSPFSRSPSRSPLAGGKGRRLRAMLNRARGLIAGSAGLGGGRRGLDASPSPPPSPGVGGRSWPRDISSSQSVVQFDPGQQLGGPRMPPGGTAGGSPACVLTRCNPRAVDSPSLLGAWLPEAKGRGGQGTWAEGLLPTLVRQAAQLAAQGPAPPRHVLVLDGPLEAGWAETLHEALEPGGVLQLPSRECLRLPPRLGLCFETDACARASPGLVARTRVVCILGDSVESDVAREGMSARIRAWARALPKAAGAPGLAADLADALSKALPGAIAAVHGTPLVPRTWASLCDNALAVLGALLLPTVAPEGAAREVGSGDPTVLPLEAAMSCIEAVVLQGLCWSVGVAGGDGGRRAFDAWARRQAAAWRLDPALPGEGLIHDLRLAAQAAADGGDGVQLCWRRWTSEDPTSRSVSTVAAAPPLAGLEVLVPSQESTRLGWWHRALLGAGHSACLVGPIASGKTLLCIDPESVARTAAVGFHTARYALCARTQAAEVRTFLRARVPWDVLQPGGGASGLRAVHVVLEDLHSMPPEPGYGSEGARAPLEMLRDLVDAGGWHAAGAAEVPRGASQVGMDAGGGPGPFSWVTMVQGAVTATMRPATTTACPTRRLINKLCILGILPADEQALTAIFSTALAATVGSDAALTLAKATLDVYFSVRTSLRPSSGAPHYETTGRDVARVVESVRRSAADQQGSSLRIARLWAHETMSVFAHRCVSKEDRTKVLEAVNAAVCRHFPAVAMATTDVADGASALALDWPGDANARPLVFADVGWGYRELASLDQLRALAMAALRRARSVAEERLAEAAPAAADGPTRGSQGPSQQLILFDDALLHLARCLRALRRDRSHLGGHLMLLGAPGTGRQSLARLAACMAGCQVRALPNSSAYSLEAWRGDLRDAVLAAGEAQKPTMLLITEASVNALDGDDGILEDCGQLLESGEIQGLLSQEETARVGEALDAEVDLDTAPHQGGDPFLAAEQRVVTGLPGTRPGTEALLRALSRSWRWRRRLRTNLHVVLVLTASSRRFVARLRDFPFLRAHCAVDWYLPWGPEALASVARGILAPLQSTPSAPSESRQDPVLLGHGAAALHLAAEGAAADARRMGADYVRPTPAHFLELCRTLRWALPARSRNLTDAHARLEGGVNRINSAEAAAAALRAELATSVPEAELKAEEVARVAALVEADEVEARAARTMAAAEEEKASRQAAEAEMLSREASADLERALPELDAALSGIKNLSQRDVLEVGRYSSPPSRVRQVVRAVRILVAGPAAAHEAWSAARRALQDAKSFLQHMLAVNPAQLRRGSVRLLDEVVADPEFVPARMMAVSRACVAMCGWVRAMHRYDEVNAIVAPKRAVAEELERALAETKRRLAVQHQEMEKINAKVELLSHTLSTERASLKALQNKVEDYTSRADLATRLLDELHTERERWRTEAADVTDAAARASGDVLLWGASVCYLAPFQAAARQHLTAVWRCTLEGVGIAATPESDRPILAPNPKQLRHLHARGLPRGRTSTENAIFLAHRRRAAMLVDPHGQVRGVFRARGNLRARV